MKVLPSDELIMIARKSSEKWSPFSNNHDPGYLRALREAYVQGFQSGYRKAEASDVEKELFGK